jgi:GntR family transcriptional regulator, trigonelline degradation regulator
MARHRERGAERPGMENSAELAYRRLRERLVAGSYEPGQRLTELGICEDLGMSRTPVREALRRLQSDELVASTGRGVVVNSLSREDIRHALELHGALDTLAARLGAEAQHAGRLSPRQLAELQEAGERVGERAAAGDARGVWEANIVFHRCLTRLSGNPLLEDASERIWDRFAIVSRANIAHRSDLTPVAHQAIVYAIVSGDVDRAAAAAAEHVREAAAMYAHDGTDSQLGRGAR